MEHPLNVSLKNLFCFSFEFNENWWSCSYLWCVLRAGEFGLTKICCIQCIRHYWKKYFSNLLHKKTLLPFLSLRIKKVFGGVVILTFFLTFLGRHSLMAALIRPFDIEPAPFGQSNVHQMVIRDLTTRFF